MGNAFLFFLLFWILQCTIYLLVFEFSSLFQQLSNCWQLQDVSSVHKKKKKLIRCSLFSQYDAVGWAPKEYNPDDKQSSGGLEQGSNEHANGQKGGSAPQSGFVWDEASGYYYDAASGFYYDANSGKYLVSYVLLANC